MSGHFADSYYIERNSYGENRIVPYPPRRDAYVAGPFMTRTNASVWISKKARERKIRRDCYLVACIAVALIAFALY